MKRKKEGKKKVEKSDGQKTVVEKELILIGATTFIRVDGDLQPFQTY